MSDAMAHLQFMSNGSARWPEVQLSEQEVLTFAKTHNLEQVKHRTDLYLAFGCVLQNPAAVRIFDHQFIGGLPRLLESILPDVDLIADLQQNLRQTLLWGPRGPGKLSEYQGTGPLRGWLTVVARRAALRVSGGQERFVRPDDEAPSAPWDRISVNPELELLKAKDGAAFKGALEAALALLTVEEAALLRAYFVDGRTLRDLAEELKRDPSTVWRRLEAIKLRLAREVEDQLRQRLGIGKSEFASLLGLVRSQLDLRVSQSLPRTA